MSDNLPKRSPDFDHSENISYFDDNLSYFHQKKVVLPTAIIGLSVTALEWFIPLSVYLYFFPPFFGVYALGHLLFPQLEAGPDIESGFMSSFYYQKKSIRRRHIMMVAAFVATLNSLLLVYLRWQVIAVE